ncbi:GMC family oxidoreductase [Aureimonas frigidaquae]|uniref:Gluconate 2-dehydrogenase acceptor n=1 Tax=Aureimonas frigidaquae TaxID=424757 RepID=A0A0P0Z3I7_9HYPH|nr:GMC family oxidoreductase [Aureimonas frigidaquae]BAT28579.1 gluconate 2-dehydrogenase acceptor [Aureimonas frigidaquae]
MNLDAMARYNEDETVDAVVIGTGAGGAPLLSRLAKAGLRVVALEAGANRHPETEYVADETASGSLYWMDERISGGDTPEAFGANNSGIGVGGSTLHWGAFVPRADPRDLRLKSDSGHGVDWPLRYKELVPYYDAVERFIGVSGPASYPWDPTRAYIHPPVARNTPAQLMAQACARFGITHADAPAALVSRPMQQDGHGTRHACVGCGYCHQGCRNGSKASMDVTFLPLAVEAGAEIRPDCMVHGFETDRQGRISAVIYRKEGRDHRQKCSAVFLCAGAIETPRLLLHTGIGNKSGQVGRNYTAHVATQVWGTFDHETRMNRGYPSSLITEDMIRPKDADFAGGYLVQSLGVVLQTFADQVARGRGLWGRELVDYLHDYNRLAGIGINGECLPSDSNIMTLSDEVDGSGMGKPLIRFSYGDNERALKAHAVAFMRSLWEEAGASDIWVMERTAHTIGTCRMATHADAGVVDPFGRSFDVPNLWIADNSVFPSALAANPALTIMALSLRTADSFLSGRPA